MTINEYQKICTETAVYPEQNTVIGLTYVTLGLASEAGEVAGVMKKFYRGDFYRDEFEAKMLSELGDVAWYLAQAATELGISLSHIFGANVEKLQMRKERGVIKGSGDDR
jgi:NTP pyrophosphatase (non-canonical NTP hydrolase)